MLVEVFDPPLCCPSGVCGPSVDPELARISSDLHWLAEQGVAVERFNLAQKPQAFVANPTVAALLREAGNAALPLVLCEGELVATGRYPAREALALVTGLPAGRAATAPASSRSPGSSMTSGMSAARTSW